MEKCYEEELDSIQRNQIQELVDLPEKKKVIGVKWVFKDKMNSKDEGTMHKARLVAEGFLKREWIDFDELFTPMAKMDTIKFVTTIANIDNWSLHQMDVKSGFLNDPLDEEIYIEQAPRLVVKQHKTKVYKVRNALYRLK